MQALAIILTLVALVAMVRATRPRRQRRRSRLSRALLFGLATAVHPEHQPPVAAYVYGARRARRRKARARATR